MNLPEIFGQFHSFGTLTLNLQEIFGKKGVKYVAIYMLDKYQNQYFEKCDIDIAKTNFKDIDIAIKKILKNIDFDIVKKVSGNIDIDIAKDILDIDMA